jgi:7,8-dihydropterin-6-yl-methyl-4-(beta-D-ribofuranosyl)aminobenzene 5'-phosphate synthase
MTKLVLLSENYVRDPAVRGEFGLSIYVETDGRKILFDTGASELFWENAVRLGVDLTEVETCVISHGHQDHTGGMLRFLKENKKAKIYVHKDAFGPTYGVTDGKIDDYDSGIPWKPEELAPYHDRFVLTDGPYWLSPGLVISGTIPNEPGFLPVEKFYRPDGIGGLRQDTMSHEQFLAVWENGGIIVFSGCSHKGIMAAVRYARELFPRQKIRGVVAGMHLNGATGEMRRGTAKRLAREEPEAVLPIHCTGLEACAVMKAELGDRCVFTGCGGSYLFK